MYYVYVLLCNDNRTYIGCTNDILPATQVRGFTSKGECRLFLNSSPRQARGIFEAPYNLKDRLERHQEGEIPATKDRLPVKLITYFAFSNKYTAFNFEKYLKSGSGRAFIKKYNLVKYDFGEVA